MTPKFWAFQKWKWTWWWTDPFVHEVYNWFHFGIRHLFRSPGTKSTASTDFTHLLLISEILHLRFRKAAVTNGINSSTHPVERVCYIPTPHSNSQFSSQSWFYLEHNLETGPISSHPKKSVEATFLNDPFRFKNTPQKTGLRWVPHRANPSTLAANLWVSMPLLGKALFALAFDFRGKKSATEVAKKLQECRRLISAWRTWDWSLWFLRFLRLEVGVELVGWVELCWLVFGSLFV